MELNIFPQEKLTVNIHLHEITISENDDTMGVWMKPSGSDVILASIIQHGNPAVTIYDKNQKNNLSILVEEGQIKLQLRLDDNEVKFFTLEELQKRLT